jgi:hypothetical protein
MLKRNLLFLIVCLTIIIGESDSVKGEDKMLNLYHGTLNLCIANKNGIVVVTDSRASSVDLKGNFIAEDWHQKLFQISEKIVVTIAGYNRVPLKKTPLFHAPAAGVILNYIEDMRQKKHEPTYQEVIHALPFLIGFYLDSVSNIKELSEPENKVRPEDYHFVMMVIGDDNGTMKISEIDVGLKRKQNFTGDYFLSAEESVKEKIINGFESCAVGQSVIADSDLQQYRKSLKKEELDALPLSKLISMAVSIMGHTMQSNPYVGGVVQLASFQNEKFQQSIIFPKPGGPLIKFISLYGSKFKGGGTAIKSEGSIVLTVSSFFEDITVFLGSPYYYFGSTLKNCKVIVEDNNFSFDASNQIENSTLSFHETIDRKSEKVKQLINSFSWKNKDELVQSITK